MGRGRGSNESSRRGQDVGLTKNVSAADNKVMKHGAYIHDLDQLNAWAAAWKPTEIKRVLVCGDFHADWGHAHNMIRRAQAEGCNTILVVGDYGYWVHNDKDKRGQDRFEQALARADITLYWIDGNHENYTALNFERPEVGEGFRVITPHILHIPRGRAWEWNGVKFLGVGGAHSTDKQWRLDEERKRKKAQRKNWFWWPQEGLNDDQEAAALEAGEADILISHDAPNQVYLPKFIEGFDRNDLMTNLNRERIGRVLKSSGAKHVFHGHYHARYETDVEVNRERVRVEGLGRNGQKGSWKVLDLDEFKAG